MEPSLSTSAQKVQEALKQHGLNNRVVELPASTRSAKEAAQAIGCQIGQIVKSLIFEGKQSGKPVLVVASGPNRVDEKKLGELMGEPIVKPDADYVRLHTGFGIGGVPPVGLAEAIDTFIDRDLLQYDEIWAAAGTPNAVFPLSPAQLQNMTGGQVVTIK